jgi:uncharacterized protein (DUF169 family)
LRCPVCHEEIPQHSRFCDRCGARITSEARLGGAGPLKAGEGLRWRLHMILKSTLNLDGHPVAVKLLRDEPPPMQLREPEEPIPHCHMVLRAYRGESLYAPYSKQGCRLGAICLGMADPGGGLKGALAELKGEDPAERFRSGALLESYLQEAPVAPIGVKGIIYTPLMEAPLDPDVIIVLGEPSQAILLLEAHHYIYGRKLHLNLGAYLSLCAESVAWPLTMGSMNISLTGGCIASGDKPLMNLLSVAIPYYMAKRITEALKALRGRGEASPG